MIELVAPVQKVELDDERARGNLSSERLDQLATGGHGPTRREKIIDKKQEVAWSNGVLMNFQRRGSILQLITERQWSGSNDAVAAPPAAAA